MNEQDTFEELRYRIVRTSTTVSYYDAADELHREDGPAVVHKNGTRSWWKHGQRHCVDSPAIEWDDGVKEWYLNGKCHREDGPAMECANGTKYWYINDNELTEAEFNARIKQSSCDRKNTK
jgi:hypothetical protein